MSEEDDIDSLTDKIGGGDEEELEERIMDSDMGDVDDVDDADETDESKPMEIEDIFEDLRSDDPEVSAEAADELERLVEEEPGRFEGHEEGLIDVLEIDDNWAVRAAASALAEVGTEDAIEPLRDLDLPEADEAAKEIEERLGIETEEEDEEEAEAEAEPATQTAEAGTDGGSAEDHEPGAEEGMAIQAAKGGEADVEFSELVVLQMLESQKEEPSEYAEQSIRHAVREYVETMGEVPDRFARALNEGHEDIRRYASIVMHEMSNEHTDKTRDHVEELVDSLGDEVESVHERTEEALTNVAEEYPEDVVGTVGKKSKEG